MTGKQRLKVLANYLLSGAVDEETFNMEEWPSCAVGEGTRLPSLAKDGLYLIDNAPKYEGEEGTNAAARFFKIPWTVADKLFGPEPRKATTVGRQILSYLRKRG